MPDPQKRLFRRILVGFRGRSSLGEPVRRLPASHPLSTAARWLRSFGRATADRVPSRSLRGRSNGDENNAAKFDVGFDPPHAEANRPTRIKEPRFSPRGALLITHRFF